MDNLSSAITEGLSFGTWIRRQRKHLDLTQDALAEAVGCAVATIRRIEAEERRPSRPMAQRLVQCLQLPPDQHEYVIAWARTGRLVLPSQQAQPTVTTPPSIPSFTPTQRTNGTPQMTLFGRDHDLQGITRLILETPVRLVTITGAPGIGKTQLGIRVSSNLREQFRDGAIVVDLAPVAEIRLVAATIAQALRIHDQSDAKASDVLIAHLRRHHVLLMLDNFEHLLDASGLIVELLEAVPQLTILITSRAPLRISMEREWPLAPLGVPERGDGSVEALLKVPSVALFVARATSANPLFELTASNAPAVVTICKRMDGIPLALELAAAWSKILTPSEIAARIGQPFAFLTRRPQDWPLRHQTLWDTITWSYGLLTPDEQALFQRLSVFSAAFSLDAALSLGNEQPRDSLIVLERLARLVDHNLIWRSSSSEGESVFGLLEIIREYGRNQLATQGAEQQTYQRYVTYYCQGVETAAPALMGAEQARWLAQLDADYPNLRSAMRWALDHQATELAARIASALWRFWHLRGMHTEGRQWLEEVLGQREALPDTLLAQVLNNLGQVLLEQARYSEAELRFSEGLAVQRRLDNPMGIARILNNLGMIAENQGDYQRARQFHEESLALKRTLDNPLATANSLNNLGIVLEAQGFYDEAWTMLEEGLLLRRAHNDHWSVAVSLLNLAQVAYLQGKPDQSLTLLRESVDLRHQLNDITGIAWGLEGIANAVSALGEWLQATRLWGAASRLREELGCPLPPSQRDLNQQNIARARLQLGEAAFIRAWEDYQGRSHAEIITEALAMCDR